MSDLLKEAKEETIKLNIEFECIYKETELNHIAELPKNEGGTVDAGDEEDVLFLCEEVYREEFLKFFGVSYFDDAVINKQVAMLFLMCNNHERFSRILRTIQGKCCIFEEDPEQAFMQLFSYQFFHLMHSCVKQLFRPDESREVSFGLLESEVLLFGTQ